MARPQRRERPSRRPAPRRSPVAALVVIALVVAAAGVGLAVYMKAGGPRTGPSPLPSGEKGAQDHSPPRGSPASPSAAGRESPKAAPLTPDDFVAVSGPTSPRVAYALRKPDGRLEVVLDIETFDPAGAGASVELGLAAAEKVSLTEADAKATLGEGRARLAFGVPADALVKSPDDWRRLRMACAVRWEGGPGGGDRLRERFRHLDSRAPHAGLSPDAEAWAPLDPDEHARNVADLKNRIAIPVEQPMDGKLTVVVEDGEGERVRNLLAGVKRTRGRHSIEWDGLDDGGNLVAPGEYRWKSIHHPGITPEYLFSFANGGERTTRPFGTNHGHFSDATATAEYVFFAATVTEGGYSMIALDFDGKWKHGYNMIHGTGLAAVAIAADETYLYAAHDGTGWGQHVDRRKPDWKAPVHLTLTRFEIETGKSKDFPRGKRYAKVQSYEHGPGAANPNCRQRVSLTGMALLGGKLYVGSRLSQAVLVVDPATAEKTGEVELPSPGALTAADGKLYAVSGKSVVRADPASGRRETVIREGVLEPRGIAVDAEGKLFVSDAKTHTVRVFSARGRPRRAYGTPGGPYAGKYDPERMVSPAGVALAGGRLWVSEARRNPKRLLAWNLAANEVVVEKFGCPSYGGPGASFDPQDHTRWIGLRCMWELDFDARTARPTSVLQKESGHLGGKIPWAIHYRFLRTDGRTLLIGMNGTTLVSELMPDGFVRDLAFLASTHRFCFGCGWNPPKEFVEAFDRAYPGRKGKHADKGPGVLWTDLNGDGRCQVDEFDFSTECEDFAGGYWGHDFADLTLRVPARVKGKRVLVTLKPEGFHAGGAPRYPRLNAACRAGVPIDLAVNQVETATDSFGNMVVNSDPAMKCLSPQGKTLWTYPNRWTNVHGSHKAPLPEAGVLQGTLFFLGMAPFDDRADVFMMNGNHGRFFVITSDGFYLDEMFKDVRLGGSRDATWVGGEAFGGSFAGSEKDGEYYLQTGGDGYRVFRLHGLKQAVRASGEITVTPEQLMSAERKLARRKAAVEEAREATVRLRRKPVKVDGRDSDWDRALTLSWDRSGRFPVKVRCAYDAERLYLLYEVREGSPWTNNGKDWTTLFKTGDSVDLQLGTDPGARPDRKGPAPGDLRLLIAPFEGKPLAVLYRHRVPGAKDPVTFTCPWRSEKVDVVKRLEGARVAVDKGGDWYRVEAAIPLAELGLARAGGPAGKAFKADFGVIYGDPEGTVNVLRSYWSNKATMLVNDVPGEIMLHPNRWGVVKFEGK